MALPSELPRYSTREELLNSLVHGLGFVLAIGGVGVLAGFSAAYGDAWHVVGCMVYATCLVLLYGASTLYHSMPRSRAKAVLQTVDHASIFLLIAGTYTPFTLVNLRGPMGWTLFGVVWGLALLGIGLGAYRRFRGSKLQLSLYLGMGWMVLPAGHRLYEAVEPGGFALLLAGGAAYSIGVIFYVWEKLPFNHAIWHVHVLAGSVLHFLAVLFYVIPSV
jgi:hemolysin III